jgi:dipeptidyl aminopeptidase/acylaminoacyl peptidase
MHGRLYDSVLLWPAEESVRRLFAVVIGAVGFNAGAAELAKDAPGYQMPPAELVKLATAPQTPSFELGPRGDWGLLLDVPPLVPIAEVAQRELKLAGLRFNPDNDGQTRSLYFAKLTFVQIPSGRTTAVGGLPADPRIRDVQWAPDGARVAFTLTRATGVELWIAERDTARAHRVGTVRLNAAHPEPPFHWLADSRTLVCRAIVANRPSPPLPGSIPGGPVTDENVGRKTPAPTFQDLLRNEDDARLLEHHLTAQVVLVDLSGTERPIAAAGLITRAAPSPDGNYLLIESLHRPFSYVVPASRFPTKTEIWSVGGKLVQRVADLPLADEVPIDFSAVRTGRREIDWRADAPATLAWVEALDGGDPRKPAELRDRVFLSAAPFRQPPLVLASLALRFSSLTWGNDNLALIRETWWKTRRLHEWRVRPGTPSAPPEKLDDRLSEDRYSDPGAAVLIDNGRGRRVILTLDEGKAILRSGDGASPEGDRPFVDRVDLTSLKTQRLWRSEAPYYERPLALLPDGVHAISRRESIDSPPNYFIRDLAKGQLGAITHFPHPYPSLLGVKKELLRYRRRDGQPLTGMLYLPPNYDGKERLPLFVWAYPREFKSADAAGQVQESPHRFVRLSWGSPYFWLARGYAVLDNPSFAIIGEGDKEPNDTYVQQLVDDAKAAIDEVVRRGVADRDRVAMCGHSYGAFTTANLLAHSRLFRAGIARSGAYNRTLTPFGFQQEERSFWEAPKTYIEMSPFTYAHAIQDPLLLIHGMEDSNQGTFPMQSERLFQALKGQGKTVRLVLLPHESHGYRARESVLHMLWEMDNWLERYVKPTRTKQAER